MSTTAQHTTDVAIIGAGPVGLFAIFECGMLKMKCHVIDTLDFIGGQCQALYPEKPIYDIPAYPKIMAGELIDKLKEQAAPFKPNYHLGQTVETVEKNDDGWFVETSKGTTIQSKVIIIAGGAGTFGPNKPPIENLDDFEGTSVFYMVGSRDAMADKTIVIAGGGDSAVDWALSLSEIAKKIYVVHRRDRFRAQPDNVEKLKALDANQSSNVELVIPYVLDSITGEGKQLSSVTVKTMDGDTKTINADILLPFFGLRNELGPIANWGIDTTKSQIPVEPSTCQTNIDGIFAIGDMAQYAGKKKLILQGFSDAAMAAYAAYDIVYPDQPMDFQHSTDTGVPA